MQTVANLATIKFTFYYSERNKDLKSKNSLHNSVKMQFLASFEQSFVRCLNQLSLETDAVEKELR